MRPNLEMEETMVAISTFSARPSVGTETWWEASEWYGDSELLKSFCSDIQDGRQTTAAPEW